MSATSAATATTTARAPSVRQVLRRAEGYLERHGVQEPSASAELLLAHVMGTDRAGLSLGAQTLSPQQAKTFGRALCRRCEGAPVQHLTGEAGFRHLVLAVRPGVFVPRPETEVLVEMVLAAICDVAQPKVVDVGTGTGAIALSIKHERPDARVVAIDRSPAAVHLAKANAAQLGLDVEVIEGDLLVPIEVGAGRALDAVVSNPPYVAEADHRSLPVDVRADPYEALVGDLSIYRSLAKQASERLGPGGVLGVEIDETSGADVCRELRAAGFIDVHLSQDLVGRDRVVTARMPA